MTNKREAIIRFAEGFAGFDRTQYDDAAELLEAARIAIFVAAGPPLPSRTRRGHRPPHPG